MNNDNKMDEYLEDEILDTIEEVKELTEPQIESSVDTEPIKKVKKHTEALILVEEAKTIVKDAEEQTVACKLLLAGDLKEYEEAKVSLQDGGLNDSLLCLDRLGYDSSMSEEDSAEDEVKILDLDEDDSMISIALKDISSGRFTGILMALVGGVVTFLALIYLSIKQSSMVLDVKQLPSQESIETIFGWYSSLVKVESVYAGMAMVLAIVFLVMFVVYAIRVSLRGDKNLTFAQSQLEEAKAYTVQKGKCKEEMDRVDVHMQETITLLKTYEVLLNEQHGKLNRILHLEEDKIANSDYHEKSFVEMHETKEMINTMRHFMGIPMAAEGKLSQKSVDALEKVKNQLNKMLSRLY